MILTHITWIYIKRYVNTGAPRQGTNKQHNTNNTTHTDI